MKKFLLVFGLILCTFFSLKAQVVDSMLRVYADQVPDQKVHVHFDKDLYRAGETIWFKSYLFSGFSLSGISKNFYAELINESGTVVQRKVYPIIEAAAAGNFDIPDSFPAGNLIFRGYTTWMLNFDTSFIFEKTIPILNKDGVPAKAKADVVARTTSIQFLPEGGSLVNSLESVVAFKANDNAGKPVFAKGDIVNSKGQVVTTFTTVHDGMGTFTLTPAANETYKAVWTDGTGKQQTTELPATKEQGIVLKINSAAKNKVFMISRTEQVPEDWKTINIVALLGQERVYKAKASLESTSVTSGSIPVTDFPSGIMQITVFSAKWEPIAERIVMVNNKNYEFDVQLKTPELNTNFRARNTLEIQVTDTILSNMSLSVTDAAIGRETTGDNIISRMLLTGDIKGYVHNPGYYFSNTSDSVAAHLDLVLLTHGWRRYNWSTLARGRKPYLKYPNETYLSIDAKVFGVTTASPLRSDEELLLIVSGKDSSRQIVQMRKTGLDKFSVPLVFFDTATLYYQFMKDKKAEKEMALAFSNNLYKGVKRVDFVTRPAEIQVDTSAIARTKLFAERLLRLGSKFESGGNVLQTVIVKTKAKSRLEELDEKYASGLFRGSDGYSFDFTGNENIGFYDIFAFLQGRVAGLQISGQGANASLSWRGSSPALFLNEMPSDVSMVSGISVNDIAYVKVLRPPFIGAMGGGAGGAIAIYTKKGGDVKVEPGKGLSKVTVTGYSAAKEFYSPDYKDLSASSSVAADYRTTLYWKPVVLTDATRQKVRLEFYNNDITKAYRIVLEGVNEIGKMVRIEKVVKQ